MDGPILTNCILYDVFLSKELLFGVEMIASALKFLVTLILLTAINSLMH